MIEIKLTELQNMVKRLNNHTETENYTKFFALSNNTRVYIDVKDEIEPDNKGKYRPYILRKF